MAAELAAAAELARLRREADGRDQVAGVTDLVIASVDPDLVIAQRAEADRDVVVRPDADGMCSLWVALPGVGGVAVEARLRALALAQPRRGPAAT